MPRMLKYAIAAAGVASVAGVAMPILTSCSSRIETHSAAQAVAPRAAAAQRIFIDPATGATRVPEAAELDAVAAQSMATAGPNSAALAAAPPEEFHLPDGTVGIRVPREAYDTIVVCRQTDGSFSTNCPATQKAQKGVRR